MIQYEEVKEFWDYLEFYPEEDEEDFDGVHYGGIRGIKPDAPLEVIEAYQEYVNRRDPDAKI